MDDLSLDLDHLEEILKNNNISIVNVVSVLGLVPDMDRLMSLKEKYGFYLIEDVCESFGSKYKNKYLGLFGDISVFSLYYGHHLSTIEGGMVCCENPEIDQILKMIREHGWDRGLTEDQKAKIRADHNTQNFSAPYTFYYPGFNVRGTDLQAFLGLSQLENAKTVIEKRNENFLRYLKRLNLEWKPKNTEDSYISNFCYPIISKNRNAIIDSLSQSGTETRPLICGTMGRQPFYSKIYGEMTLPNCDLVDKFGLYIPNNSDLSEEELNIIINAVNESKDS
jgi:CDP-6-deoxy-D-xylo-4-hexulose-3-dehydrase